MFHRCQTIYCNDSSVEAWLLRTIKTLANKHSRRLGFKLISIAGVELQLSFLWGTVLDMGNLRHWKLCNFICCTVYCFKDEIYFFMFQLIIYESFKSPFPNKFLHFQLNSWEKVRHWPELETLTSTCWGLRWCFKLVVQQDKFLPAIYIHHMC